MKIAAVITILAAAYNIVCFVKKSQNNFRIVYLVNAIVLFICSLILGYLR